MLSFEFSNVVHKNAIEVTLRGALLDEVRRLQSEVRKAEASESRPHSIVEKERRRQLFAAGRRKVRWDE